MMYIKHDPAHVDELLFGSKSLTARLLLAFDEYKHLDEGDRVELLTSGGFKFAEATINKISVMTVDAFVASRLDGHKTYSSSREMIRQFEKYYPEYEGDIDGDNKLAIIWYEDITMVHQL